MSWLLANCYGSVHHSVYLDTLYEKAREFPKYSAYYKPNSNSILDLQRLSRVFKPIWECDMQSLMTLCGFKIFGNLMDNPSSFIIGIKFLIYQTWYGVQQTVGHNKWIGMDGCE